METSKEARIDEPERSSSTLCNGTTPKLIVLFGLLTGLGGILSDAVLAHGLFWDNDPYWTYWVTKTFLIMAVYLFGVSLLGLGLLQGIVITIVHTLVLTAYYAWLAPIGLPQEPEWLDMNHLWVTGLPAHFLVILCGYLGSLWIWRRNGYPERLNTGQAKSELLRVLVGTVTVIVLATVGHQLAFREFPGFTYLIQHFLAVSVFLFAWSALIGFDSSGAIMAGLLLSFVWLGYAMYLSPVGLPYKIQYMGFEELWFKEWPNALVAGVIGALVASHRVRGPRVLSAIIILIFIHLPRASQAQGLPASASTNGACMQIVGPDPVDMRDTVSGMGTVYVHVVENGNRWSHVQNIDYVDVSTHWTAGGNTYDVLIDKVMPRHPLGKYTVWNGVVFRHEMHGHTGIGTRKLPLMKPEIALWGWARVMRNGTEISRAAPAHLMVMKEGPMPGIMLEVDTEEKGLLGVPDHYLTVMWPKIDSLQMPESAERSRKIVGWIALLGFTVLLWVLASRARPRTSV